MWTEQDLLAPERSNEERAREKTRRRRLTWGAVAAVGIVALGLAIVTADTSEPPPITEELEIEVNYIDEPPEEVSPGSRP